MISDDKRRKAAANLRSLDDEAKALIVEQMHKLTYEEIDASLVLMLGLFVAVDAAGLEMKQSGNFWNLLADLIDRPTCRLDLTDVETHGNVKVRIYECSRCGRTCEDVYGKYERCPHCGGVVVEDD